MHIGDCILYNIAKATRKASAYSPYSWKRLPQVPGELIK